MKEIWKVIRNIDNGNQGRKDNEVLVVNGVGYVDDSDKVRMFKKTYKAVSRLPRSRSDKKIKHNNRKYLNKRPEEMQDTEGAITREELERAIRESKDEKAAGDDDLPYELIKALGERAKEYILVLYNKIWEGDQIPQKWRTATIKPLLKDGKDPSLPSSYRPISLTACLGKILEKTIANKLSHFLETNNLINENQAGFRNERCTTDQVLKLVQMATDKLQGQKKDGSATIVTFFDFEKAYDKMWRDGLLHKMIAMGIPYRFVKYTRHFLSARRTKVEVNRTNSKNFWLNEGLPQGSAISPLLFLIFINDIDGEVDKGTPPPSLFADDTAVWVSVGKNKKEAEERMQKAINNINEWAGKWKMKLNTGKTEAMIISSNPNDIKWKPELTLNGRPIVIVKEYKFLGVIIDSGLRFRSHVKKVVGKGKRRNNILRCLAGKDWGQTLEAQKILYLTYVRSALEYAGPSWYPWLSATSKRQIEAVQNDSLRIMSRMSKTTPIDFLRCETGIEPLELRMTKNNMITFERYRRLEKDDNRRRMMEKEVKCRLTTRKGWRHETKPRMEKYDCYKERDKIRIPPWAKPNIEFEEVELERKKEDYTREELERITTEKINSIGADIEIYTDGSTSGQQQNGGAGVHVTSKEGNTIYEDKRAAGKYCSSYDGECIALRMALDWIQEREKDETHYLILTDSKSLKDALQNNNWKDTHETIREIKRSLINNKSKITMCWIPSHCGTRGNERADTLANEGTKEKQEEVPVTSNIICAKIRNESWTPNHKRTADTFVNRRKPKIEVESKWPIETRRTYSRIRSGHAKELKHHRHFINMEENSDCECGEGKETIEHVLCHCPILGAKRRREHHEEMKIEMLADEPEICRRILSARFDKLTLKKNQPETQPVNNDVTQPSEAARGSRAAEPRPP